MQDKMVGAANQIVDAPTLAPTKFLMRQPNF